MDTMSWTEETSMPSYGVIDSPVHQGGYDSPRYFVGFCKVESKVDIGRLVNIFRDGV